MDNAAKTQTHPFVALMEAEMRTALGCTEPIAVAYTAAVARKHAGGPVTRAVCRASVNIIKNVAAVIIPGTGGRKGMKLACALGLVAPHPEKGLELLDGLAPECLDEAMALVEDGRIEIEVAEVESPLYIEVALETEGHWVRSITKDSHTNTVSLEVDGVVAYREDDTGEEENDPVYADLNLFTIHEFGKNAPLEDLDVVRRSIKTNMAIAQDGLANHYGLQVGRTIASSIEKKTLSDDIANYAMMLAAAGSDARMAGSGLPAFSNSGSGNQGITATIPVVAAAQKLGAGEEALIRACAVSNLVAIFIKHQLGRLTPVCGAVIAATGSSCGIVCLMGGGLPEMVSAVKNMLGNVSGMFCDGAKASCALKVSTCVGAAVQAALLAIESHAIQGTDGIVGNTADETVANYSKILSEGVPDLDKALLDIIIQKE